MYIYTYTYTIEEYPKIINYQNVSVLGLIPVRNHVFVQMELVQAIVVKHPLDIKWQM
jgi:hypothetical protein